MSVQNMRPIHTLRVRIRHSPGQLSHLEPSYGFGDVELGQDLPVARAIQGAQLCFDHFGETMVHRILALGVWARSR